MAPAAFVSNWGADTVTVVDTSTLGVARTVYTGTHPRAIVTSPLRDETYVANADSDTITVLGGASTVLRSIDLRPYSGAPIGASPDALTVSPDGGTLYVANANDDDVAVVVQLGAAGATHGDRVLGLIPTAGYASGGAIDAAGKTLFVTNMQGLGAGPNLDEKPSAYVADNDLPLGRLVQAVSQSPFWASTAIFAVEDDAQDGPDHVDGHRSIAFAISPCTQRGIVDSTSTRPSRCCTPCSCCSACGR